MNIDKLNRHEHELVRETAGQMAGFEPSPMYGRIPHKKPPMMKGLPGHLKKIMQSENPARLNEMSHNLGGGFNDSLKQVLTQARDSLGKQGHHVVDAGLHVGMNTLKQFEPVAAPIGRRVRSLASTVNIPQLKGRSSVFR
jgi:hypothetical protein